MTDGKLEQLDRLLDQVKDDPAIARLADSVEDSGHASEELLEQYRKELLPPESKKALRRHLLFCDACSSLILRRGGEVDDEATDGPSSQPKSPHHQGDPKGNDRNPLSRRTALKLCVGLGAGALSGAAIWWLQRSDLEDVMPTQDDLIFGVAETIVLKDGVESRQTVTAPGDVEFALAFSLNSGAPFHHYVMVASTRGHLEMLYPRSGEFSTASGGRGIQWLPATASTEHEGERAGWPLAPMKLTSGDAVVVMLFVSAQRLSIFEGEVVTATTLPRFKKSYLENRRRVTRDDLTSLARQLRAANLADALQVGFLNIQ